MTQTAIHQYQKLRREGSIQGASPHKLILILFDNALERMTMAQGCIQRNEISEKAHHIAVAASILDGLRAASDPNADKQLVDNLRALYDYCIRLLLRANLSNEVALLAEASHLIREIRAAWVQIPSYLQGGAGEQQQTLAAAG